MLPSISNNREDGTVTQGTGRHTNAEISALAWNGPSSWSVLFIAFRSVQASSVVLQWAEDSRMCLQCVYEPV